MPNHDIGSRTLVIILSETRSHELVFESFKQNLLRVFDADLALCVADNDREDNSNPFYQNAKHIWQYREPKDWKDAYNYTLKIHNPEADAEHKEQLHHYWFDADINPFFRTGATALLVFFRWFLKQKLIESRAIEQYDRFLVTRSDYLYPIPHTPPKFLKNRSVWIPDGEDYGGFTDRHVIANRANILKVLSIADEILSKPKSYYEALKPLNIWNIEQLNQFHLKRVGLTKHVNRYPYTMYAIRTADTNTSWSSGDYDENLGFFVKYRNELDRANLAKQYIQNPEDWSWLKFQYLRLRNQYVSMIENGHWFVKLINPLRKLLKK